MKRTIQMIWVQFLQQGLATPTGLKLMSALV